MGNVSNKGYKYAKLSEIWAFESKIFVFLYIHKILLITGYILLQTYLLAWFLSNEMIISWVCVNNYIINSIKIDTNHLGGMVEPKESKIHNGS